MTTAHQQNPKIKLATLVVAIVVVAGVVLLMDHFKKTSAGNPASFTSSAASTTPTSPTTTNDTPTGTTSPASDATYKDGSYTSTIDYYVPHGQEEIQVNLTLSNGAVSNVSIQNSESDRDSAQYQEDFASMYKSYVVGKKLSGLQIGVIAGASDTTQAFNQALSQIAAKAQA